MAKPRVKKEGMTNLEIRIGLLRRGIKLSKIAVRAGVKPAAVTKALNDKDEYLGRRLRPYIAEALGLPVDKIWPPAEKQKIAQ